MRARLVVVLALTVAAVSIVAGAIGASATPSARPTTTTGATTTTLPAEFTTGWAVVDVDGHLAYGSGAVSSRQVGADGTYEVIFNRDVSHCAYVATSGDYTGDNYAGPDDALTMGVAPSDGNVNGVFLLEYDTILARDNYSSGFHLIVTC